MSSPNERNDLEFEERLQQILRAEADSFTPSAEGLQLIRERTERQRGSAWFGLPWLRPAVAVAGAVLIAASVIMSSPQVRDQVLEIVPAGSDHEGAPPASDEGDGDGAPVPDTASDSATGTSKPTEEAEDTPQGSPTAENEEGADDEGLEATSSCPPREEGPTPTASSTDGEKNDKSSDPECDPEKEPTDEPSSPGTDPGTDPGETTEPDEPDGGGDSGNGGSSGNNGNGGSEVETPGSE